MKHGGDIEGRNLDNFTPLHVALKGNNIEAVQELIAQGCDINASGGIFYFIIEKKSCR